jgi:hypothetical protein
MASDRFPALLAVSNALLTLAAQAGHQQGSRFMK